MMTGYCWNLVRDFPGRSHSQMSYKMSLLCVELLERFYHKRVLLVRNK
jgi:hypothetical protein